MQIKYLHNSFLNANQKGLLSEYLFFLQIKALHLPGDQIHKGALIKTIQQTYNYSTASISAQMKKLVNAGFVDVYKHANGKDWKYVVRSYRCVWNKLGFRFSEYIERYKFSFIESSKLVSKQNMKALLFALELHVNKEKQIYKQQSKLNKQIEYHTTTLNQTKEGKVKERKKTALKQLHSIKLSLEDACLGGCAKRPMENKISCKRAVKILGFSSAKTCVNLHKKAQDLQLLLVKKSKSLVAAGISRIQFNHDPSYEGCYWMFGKVYKNECNSYVFTANIRNQSLASRQISPLQSH